MTLECMHRFVHFIAQPLELLWQIQDLLRGGVRGRGGGGGGRAHLHRSNT